jgi:UDP-N-acetylglucosamine acyltransferase
MSDIKINPLAIVSDKAIIGNNVEIGPFSIIEDDVEIGNNTKIRSHVQLANGARIGSDCLICNGVVIATEPQDLKFKGEQTFAVVGDRTVIREYCTINRATSETNYTIVGNDCLIMAYCHVAHDCKLGDKIIMANVVQMGGHVKIESNAFIGGAVKIHQFCRIGCHAMIGADSMIVKDVPPYTLIGNVPLKIEGLNKIGLKRKGFSSELISELDYFYKIILNSGFNNQDGLRKYLIEHDNIPEEVKHCIEFIQNSPRGIYR